MIFDSRFLRLYILPGNPPADFGARDLYNLAYAHYKKVWERTFTLRAGEGAYDAYGFFRQDYSLCLFYEGQIAAQACSSIMHLDFGITHDLKLFQNFKGTAEELMLSRGVRSLATIEYSSVARDFSPRKTGGIVLNEVINDLSSREGFRRGVGAMVGQPRRVTGTNDRAMDLGYRRISESQTRLGLSVDVMVGFENELREHEDADMRALIDKIWIERMDLTNSTVEISGEKSAETFYSQSKSLISAKELT